MEFYLVKFKEQYDTDKGPKWSTKQYLVNAVSVGDAEAKTTENLSQHGIEFRIVSVSKSLIEEILQ